MKLSEYIFSFLMGFFLYSLVEIAGRGYTHWTMAVTGGLILALLYGMNRSGTLSMIRCCFAGSLLITGVEFCVGIFDNLIMHWNVWDYSDLPFNLMGQICLPFSFAWFFLCIPAYYVCRGIRKQFSSPDF